MGKQTWQNEALDLLQDKTVRLLTRRRVAGFRCITFEYRVVHLIQTGYETWSSPHNELLRAHPGSMKKAGEAAGVVFGEAVVAVVNNDGRYESLGANLHFLL